MLESSLALDLHGGPAIRGAAQPCNGPAAGLATGLCCRSIDPSPALSRLARPLQPGGSCAWRGRRTADKRWRCELLHARATARSGPMADRARCAWAWHRACWPLGLAPRRPGADAAGQYGGIPDAVSRRDCGGLIPVPTSAQLTGPEISKHGATASTPALIVADPMVSRMPDRPPCPVLPADALAAMDTLPPCTPADGRSEPSGLYHLYLGHLGAAAGRGPCASGDLGAGDDACRAGRA